MSFEIQNGVLTTYAGADTEVIIPEGVTGIGARAFENCKGIKSVILPHGVTEIGAYAFKNCTALVDITLPESMMTLDFTAFDGCPHLAVHIENLAWWCKKSFCFPAFHSLYLNREKLTAIMLPDEVSSVCVRAFWRCRSLSSITLPEGLTHIGSYAFYGTGLTQIRVPVGVTEIGTCTFADCKALSSVTLPEGLTDIEVCAFTNCESLTELILPEGLLRIADRAFQGCGNLARIRIPQSLAEMGYDVFDGCPDLHVYISDMLWWCEKKFSFPYQHNLYLNDEKLVEFTVPKELTSLGKNALSYCGSLRSVTVPAHVTSIENGAFYGCWSVHKLTILGMETSYEADNRGNLNFSCLPERLKIFVRSPALFKTLTTGAAKENKDPLFLVCLTDEDGEVLAMRVNNCTRERDYVSALNAVYTLKYPLDTDAKELSYLLYEVTEFHYGIHLLHLAANRNFDAVYLLFSLRAPTKEELDFFARYIREDNKTEATRLAEYRKSLFPDE